MCSSTYFYSLKMYLWCAVVLVFIVSSGDCDTNFGGETYKILPPIFHIDDYEKCKREEKQFCKVTVLLRNKGQNDSYYWKLIEESVNDFRAYNHDELYHAICTNDFCPELTTSEKENWRSVLSQCYNKKYSYLGLEANVVSYNCQNHDNIYTSGIIDYIWIVCLVSYGILAIASCYFDYTLRKDTNKIHVINQELGTKYLLPFSVISNWEKLEIGNRSAAFQKLKCIQGIRFYNTLLIIFCHTYSSYIGGYVYNTSYIENIPKSLLRLGIRNLMVFLVQTFFLFSGFFLSYRTFQVMDKNPTFSKKYIMVTFLNRYLRIVPPVIVMIGFGATTWIVSLFHGPIKDLYSDLEYQRCRKNWWTTLLFINNHYNQHDMCYFITWYLAADTQLYILSLIVLSLIWIYKKNTKEILMSVLLIGIFIPMVISYIYDLDIIYRITPENSKNNKFRSFQFDATYSSSYANMATFMIGLYFGYFYFKYENRNLFKEKKARIGWMLSFLGIPTLVIFTSCFYYSSMVRSFLCGVLKPTYAIGIAIGIFGMSQKVGGILRKICEWHPAVFLGNFTYSTYVVHYGIVFYRTATAKQPLFLSDFILVKSFISDVVLSFFCGFLMHILVEMPAQQLQKILLPQVKKVVQKKEEKQK